MNIPLLNLPVLLICAHFVGDWFCQWPAMAQNKSKKLGVLALHVAIVTAVLYAFLLVYYPDNSLAFIECLAANAALHAAIDWNIWRIYAWWSRRRGNTDPLNDFWFWKFIAADQLLHLVILMILFR